jgi:hypothetical protein
MASSMVSIRYLTANSVGNLVGSGPTEVSIA